MQAGIIVTASTLATVALQRETRTIPIVFVDVTDPVASGIVPRLDRPSGNISGFGFLEAPTINAPFKTSDSGESLKAPSIPSHASVRRILSQPRA